MSVELREMINFHLTGKRSAGEADSLAGLVPAALAPYKNLDRLRYDFPLVLLEGAAGDAYVDTLTGVINRLLRDIAPEGSDGEQLRQHVLRLESRMRELVSDSQGVPLAELWQMAEQALLADCAEDEVEWLGNSIATARFALRAKGLVVDCDGQLPTRLITHAWQCLRAGDREFQSIIVSIIIQLRNILKVDEMKRGAAKSPQKLKASVGKRHAELFDFDRMADLLDDVSPRNVLSDVRKKRLRRALDVLESQRFFDVGNRADRYDFVFDSLAGALKAYEHRLDEMSAVVKALAITELELNNAYREDVHDSYFERFDASSLSPEDIAQFPGYLVCLQENDCSTRDLARLMEIVTCDLPIKVMIHVSDPLGTPSPVDGLPHRGSFAQQLASTFVTGNAFVVQAPACNLYRQHDDLRRCIEYAGPGIISIYAPLGDDDARVSSYLLSAAALESRVFPAFRYDPAGGERLADRFDLSRNPDIGADWPIREFGYEDEALQAIEVNNAFTPADFALLHPQYCDHFVLAANASRSEDLVDVAASINGGNTRSIEAVPGIYAVDSDNVLRRLVVDEKLMRIVRRCRERWHVLQELGRTDDTRAVTEPQPHSAEEPNSAEEKSPVSEADEAPAAGPEAQESEADPVVGSIDEPYIETPRCTTCDECTKRNDRMFAYDDNRQAYIKDPAAGSYRELVEAAEMCQVAIIHPGKPLNPDEPGLEQLIERARPFNE